MWKKSKLILLSSALTFSLTCGSTNFVALAANNIESGVRENITLNYLKIKYENKVLFHEQVPQKTIIQVLNTNGEVLESEVLTGDKEFELAAPKIPKGKMLSYWGVFRHKDKITIDPMLIDAKELTMKFSTTEGGGLLENNAQTKVIVKSVNKGTNLKDVLPEVIPKNHYKFTGWFTAIAGNEEKIKEIDNMKVLDSKGEYYAKFYPDFNDNGIDDRTEEIALKFVTNSHEEFKDIKTQVGKQIKLPVLKKNDSVFMGWYTDEEFKNKVTDNVFTESQTLYAKWEKAEKVIKEAQTKPITDKDVSDQVERILKEKLPSSNKNDSSVTQKSSQPLPKGDSGAYNPDVNKNQINDPGVPQSNTFKETKYVFANKNIGEQYMVKFFDENESFLFSLTLPYGKTIKTYDEDERFHDEYAVRQDTTITLNTKKYVHEDSFLLGFKTREAKVNSTQITEVYPDTKSNVNVAANEPYDHQKELEEKNEAKTQNIIIYSLVTVALVIFSGVGIYLFKKRKKRALLDTI
ncbi:InlB B-repeat-containing protein [Lysinibacillus xylanilyticus]|uniref:InlB B-repeat-containing protein n=1 Tax=Lysinibacillus xylanilyticus TaxID=582475 RepID=UPI002E22D608|nr:InlB B-repeat-containing protein [Lysinibacillus xylanilyticus]